MRERKVHFAVKNIVRLACGISHTRTWYDTKRGVQMYGGPRKTTFIRREVTCERCKKTKAFKKRKRKQYITTPQSTRS